MPSITIPAQVSSDPIASQIGVLFEPYPAVCANTQVAPTTQTVFGIAVYATAGVVATGIKIRNAVAAAGTSPTTARFGLADSTGKMLAISANANAAASWPTGVCPFPFSATYTIPTSGLYYACYVVNGTWGTTQPTPVDIAVSSPAFAADGSYPPPTFSWAGQTDLPAVNSSLTLTTTTTRNYYLAVY